MQIKARGIVTAVCDRKTTNSGMFVQQIHFEQENGKPIYPSLLGVNVNLLNEILPGDVIDITFHISGSKGTYNNVIIDELTRV